MNIKEFLLGDDRAVSPVIGVILMVAITVILAAVIGTFVLGLGDNVSTNIQAGASANFQEGENDGTVRVTWNSNQNAKELNVRVEGKAGLQGDTTVTSDVLKSVGESVTFVQTEDGNQDVTVIVTAVGEDGDEKTVILEKSDTI